MAASFLYTASSFSISLPQKLSTISTNLFTFSFSQPVDEPVEKVIYITIFA